MVKSRFRPGSGAVLLLATLSVVGTSLTAAAQQSPSPSTRPAASVEAPIQGAPILNQNAAETRQQFYKVLEQHPPALGRVLRLDPTLMTNQAYLASYPNIAAFFARYPDVPRNPGFYLERYEANYNYNQPMDARGESIRMWRDALEFMGAFTVFCVVIFALFSLIKYVVEYRRWHRISKVNAEVHNKILDRFASNEELLAYVDSPAGRRFLEATPIAPTAAPTRSIGAPFGRILFSVQVGVILLALAVGFLVISGRAIEEVQPVLVSLAVLGFCLGTGSIMSAAASYAISRKLGLLPETPAGRPEHLG
jgi:hypothetical protein